MALVGPKGAKWPDSLNVFNTIWKEREVRQCEMVGAYRHPSFRNVEGDTPEGSNLYIASRGNASVEHLRLVFPRRGRRVKKSLPCSSLLETQKRPGQGQGYAGCLRARAVVEVSHL